MIEKYNVLVRVEDNDIENGTFMIPDNIVEIGELAFSGCSFLETINIPNNVIEIGKEAFSYCLYLKTVIIPENVTKIEAWTFHNCTSLKTIKIPENVTNIEDCVFYRCGLQSKKGKYKAFDKGLECNCMKYNPYEWNEIDGDIIMCEHGLHYVTNMFDIFSYHAGNLEEDIEIWEVEPGNIIVDNDEDSTKATNKIKPIRKLSRIEIINILNNK